MNDQNPVNELFKNTIFESSALSEPEKQSMLDLTQDLAEERKLAIINELLDFETRSQKRKADILAKISETTGHSVTELSTIIDDTLQTLDNNPEAPKTTE
jgi:hypothetical protein